MEIGKRIQLQISKSQSAPELGLTLVLNHTDKFIAEGTTCISCCLRNHFAQISRRAKSNSQRNIFSNVIAIDIADTSSPPHNKLSAIIHSNYNSEYEYDYASSEYNIVASIARTISQSKPPTKNSRWLYSMIQEVFTPL